jgi:hypothetical protein
METNTSPTLWMTTTGMLHTDKDCAESRRNSQAASPAPKGAETASWARPCKKCMG